MKKVLFFDVETNNLRNDRICQLAVIYEEDGKEKYSNSWYINPESPFSERTVQIHGITSEMVKDAPTFPEVWKEIHEYFERSLVIGHNVSFDLTVLDKVFQFYDISADSFTYGDTKDKALQMYNCPDSLGLHPLCDYYGISLDNHHDAMCDTKACRDLYHLFDNYSSWSSFDERTYWFGKAKLKADPNELQSSLLDLDGIVFGIVADGDANYLETTSVQNWCDEHSYQRKYPGFSEAYEIVDKILANGLITQEDSYRIHQIALDCRGNRFSRETIALQTLKGIISGILSDEKIEKNEIISLQAWMKENESLRGNYPFDTIFETIERVMNDDVLSEEERKELTVIFSRFVDPLESSDSGDDVSIAGKTCCLSGNFAFGTKADVEKKITEMGGIVVPSVTKKTDILIVGGEGSSAWAYGNYGSKVKKALKMQEQGNPIEIVGETQIL